MLLKCISFFYGYVTVKVFGGSLERFMNLCAFKRRDIWDFRSVDDGLIIKVRISEYKNLRSAAKRAGCRMRIQSKHGLPFWIRRYRHRYGLVVGVLLFFFLLQFLCGRIWTVAVQGNVRIPAEEITLILRDAGISKGISVNAYDWATVRQQILSNNPQLSWMSLNPVGTVLHVDVSETADVPERINFSEPCNLIAASDGRIVDMQINQGKPMVQVGDGVVKGDLLVSGAVEYADGCTVLRHASGKVTAETCHTVSFEVPLVQTHQKRSGKVVRRHVLNCFGISVPLFFGSVQEPYEKQTEELTLVISDTELPISVQTATFYLTQPVTVTLTEEEAIAEGVERVQNYIQTNLSEAKIMDIAYEKINNQDIVTVTAKIFCIENIVLEEKMLIF